MTMKEESNRKRMTQIKRRDEMTKKEQSKRKRMI